MITQRKAQGGKGTPLHNSTSQLTRDRAGEAWLRTDMAATCSGSEAGLPEMPGIRVGESEDVRGGSQKLRAWLGGSVLP